MNDTITDMNTENQIRSQLRKKLRNRKIKRTIVWVVVIALLISSFLIYSFYKDNGYLPWGQKKAPTSLVKEVEAKVYENSYATTIDLSGYVKPNDTQTVILRSTGTITKVSVKEGDAVRQGDSLVAIDNTNAQYAVAKLQADIETARLNGSKRDLDLLELQLKTATNNLDYTQAYASFDGVVADVAVSEGDYFEAGDTAMTIIDRSKLKATVEIDEIDMQYIKLGQTASLVFDSLPGKTLEGIVTYIPMLGRYTTQGIGVMDVEITIENPPGTLAPGFTFEGTIVVDGEVKLTLLPQSAVTTNRGTSTVIKKLEDGNTKTVTVTVKYLGEGICQLLSGDLKIGDTLIIRKTDTSASALASMTLGTDSGRSSRR
ncbi:efflux RND transporter periplasmic adaptor subunit [uncultured Sphaerochaeta sp.]|uniref:efflux RND transporter periplasmic adaptor subunit n=1 Tax=uncultured Sphaerochaeta sp. TaxID=886478 RepID=UPI002A0A7AA6|nr:efflux RND transporter periplasmic adaptor subunit [uncultured Sphaerochaeta sp.]